MMPFRRGGCPYCGGEDAEMVREQNSELKKKLLDSHYKISFMEDKFNLQEEVIKEQIKEI